ncbi:MAG: radical SAM protein [Fusobacterium gastrosuis]|uniref:radical SAM protein n=1 Tax=Fusobacterium gastrosuis TaxID=1755100 RepID=UPI002A9A60E3|nr:radical SAM protein [Fusobacteriaceae bacterium]MDY5795452.1 radical SAM protein [Fusobacterium gastrosuis]
MNFKLILGYKCNMRCNYCYQIKSHSNKKDMSYKIIDKFIERFNKLDGTHNINFFGGEPLLYVDEIKYIMDRIDKKHSISISTNGSLRGAFYELEKYWGSPIANLLSNKQHRDFTKLNDLSSFRYIVTKENINDLTENLVRFLGKHYKGKLSFKYDMSKKWELKDIQKMEEVEKQLKNIIGNNYKMELPVNMNSKFACPYIKNKEVVLNYNGDYLACHRNENSILGNVLNDDFKFAGGLDECLDTYTNKIENLYSYGTYEFKSLTIFRCD